MELHKRDRVRALLVWGIVAGAHFWGTAQGVAPGAQGRSMGDDAANAVSDDEWEWAEWVDAHEETDLDRGLVVFLLVYCGVFLALGAIGLAWVR